MKIKFFSKLKEMFKLNKKYFFGAVFCLVGMGLTVASIICIFTGANTVLTRFMLLGAFVLEIVGRWLSPSKKKNEKNKIKED